MSDQAVESERPAYNEMLAALITLSRLRVGDFAYGIKSRLNVREETPYYKSVDEHPDVEAFVWACDVADRCNKAMK
jgi:hypothetical protein